MFNDLGEMALLDSAGLTRFGLLPQITQEV